MTHGFYHLDDLVRLERTVQRYKISQLILTTTSFSVYDGMAERIIGTFIRATATPSRSDGVICECIFERPNKPIFFPWIYISDSYDEGALH